MGDMREAWDDYKEMKREQKAEELPPRIAAIRALANQGYTVRELTDTQFRIDEKLDLYPVHQRYHFLPRNKRGGYRRETALQIAQRYLGTKVLV